MMMIEMDSDQSWSLNVYAKLRFVDERREGFDENQRLKQERVKRKRRRVQERYEVVVVVVVKK